MKKVIKKALGRLLSPLIRRLGYTKDAQDTNEKEFLLDNFFSILKKIDFDPKHIVDVGANHGTWTRKALKYFPDAYFTLLEPQKWLEDDVKDLLSLNPKIKFHPVGAGSTAGVFKFTIAGRDDSSTFRLTEEEIKNSGLRQIDVRVVTLNEFVKAEDLPVPDLIKIDAEGLDLEVVKGASDFFGKTEVFMVEASVSVKEFQNDLLNVISTMNEYGYSLFEITDLNRPLDTPVLCLAELVFVRKKGFIDSQKFT